MKYHEGLLSHCSLPHSESIQPSAWVARFASLMPPGEVLDLACGNGRHARLLSRLGHAVVAVDRDPAALEMAAGPSIITQQIDLEAEGGVWPYKVGRFTGIVVTNYLHRPLFPHIFHSLAAGGVLIYETFAQGNEEFGKPSNSAFLLQPGELLAVCEMMAGMRILAFEDGYVSTPKPAMVQRVCAVKIGAGLKPSQLRL